MNALSHRGTTEFVVRFTQPEIVKYIERFTHVEERARRVRWGDEYALTLNQLPLDTCPRCGNVLRPRPGPYGVFYGCDSYPNCKGQNVSESQLAIIPALTSVPCSGCRQGLMRLRVQGRDRWLECAASAPCDYRRKIIITE